MRIGKVAKQSGVGVETIRFYEKRRLIKQPRRPNDCGYRPYSDHSVQRIQCIHAAQRLGLSLAEFWIRSKWKNGREIRTEFCGHSGVAPR